MSESHSPKPLENAQSFSESDPVSFPASEQTPEESQAHLLSSLIDGELAPDRAEVLIAGLSQRPADLDVLQSYWLISDSLQSVTPPKHRPLLAKRIAQALENEPIHEPVKTRMSALKVSSAWTTRGHLRLAASFAAIAFVSGSVLLLQDPMGFSGPSGSSGANPEFAQKDPLSSTPRSSLTSPSLMPQTSSSVLRASFDNPHARVLLEAHGSVQTRMRMDDR